MKTIEQLRHEIEQTDAKIIGALAERLALSKLIGQIKWEEGKDIVDLSQESRLFELYNTWSLQLKLQPTFIKRLFKIIIAHSRRVQKL